ncbi:uncharacterized protein VTP21DRAFT_5751 [Calcarisporiella thermophila]|uniref:uncharacterized protein n=1 Tax=Calcarisporiella thermophila TaxID=911321 RepID=UPI003743C4BA
MLDNEESNSCTQDKKDDTPWASTKLLKNIPAPSPLKYSNEQNVPSNPPPISQTVISSTMEPLPEEIQRQFNCENPISNNPKAPSRTLNLQSRFMTMEGEATNNGLSTSPKMLSGSFSSSSNTRFLGEYPSIGGGVLTLETTPTMLSDIADKLGDKSWGGDDVHNRRKPESSRFKKKKRPPALHQTSSPAEVFAAYIANAIDDASEDENEQFMYRRRNQPQTPNIPPFAHSVSNPPTPTSSTFTSRNQEPLFNIPSKSTYNILPIKQEQNTLSRLINRGPSEGGEEYEQYPSSRRIVSTRKTSTGSVSTLSSVTSNQHSTKVLRVAPEISRPYEYVLTPGVPSSSRKHNTARITWKYVVEDERAPLVFPKFRETPWIHESLETRRALCIAFLLAFIFFFAPFFENKSLEDVRLIGITNVTATDRELIFDLHVNGRNVNRRQLDIKAGKFLIYAVPSNSTTGEQLRSECQWTPFGFQFLGEAELERSLVFISLHDSSRGERTTTIAVSGIHLVRPGGKNHAKWLRILQNTFEIYIDGLLWQGQIWKQSIKICGSVRISP